MLRPTRGATDPPGSATGEKGRRSAGGSGNVVLIIVLLLCCTILLLSVYMALEVRGRGGLAPAALCTAPPPPPLDAFGTTAEQAQQRLKAYRREAHRCAEAMKRFGGIRAHQPNLGHVWNHKFLGDGYAAQQSYWNFFAPLYSCPYTEHYGNLGDGGKFLCAGSMLLTRPKCVVYSIGSNGVVDFEQDILDNVACDVHVFDPTVTNELLQKMETQMNEGREKQRIWFHGYGIASQSHSTDATQSGLTCYGPTPFSTLLKPRAKPDAAPGGCEMRSLDDFMSELGHSWVDVLKIDVEGAEFELFFDMFQRGQSLRFTQMAIEVHWGALGMRQTNAANEALQLLQGFQDRNLHAFHIEVNSWNAPQTCVEISYLKVDPVSGFVIDSVAKDAAMNATLPIRGW